MSSTGTNKRKRAVTRPCACGHAFDLRFRRTAGQTPAPRAKREALQYAPAFTSIWLLTRANTIWRGLPQRRCPLPASPRLCKWFCGGPVYSSGRASVCSLALIAAGSCERAAGSGGAERLRSGAAGAFDTAAREQIMGCGAKGANRGQRLRGAGVGPFLLGTGVTFLRGGGEGGEGQPGLPRPAGAVPRPATR
jgi:hypothetical protein